MGTLLFVLLAGYFALVPALVLGAGVELLDPDAGLFVACLLFARIFFGFLIARWQIKNR